MTESEQKEIFKAWLDQHKGIFFKIVRAYAFTPHDQDDLFQEISLKVWQSIPDFRGESKVSTWIYRVALFAATVWIRQEKKELSTQPLADVEYVLGQVDQEQDERVSWLYQQIGELEPVDRSVCLLMLEGFTYKEMATMLGISESNVGVRIHRIKTHLTRRSKEMG